MCHKTEIHIRGASNERLQCRPIMWIKAAEATKLISQCLLAMLQLTLIMGSFAFFGVTFMEISEKLR